MSLVLTTTVGGNFSLLTQDGQTVDVSAQPDPGATLLSREWTDNGADPTECAENVGTIVASVTPIAQLTGAFRVIVTGSATNDSGENDTTLSIGISTGDEPTPLIYVQGAIPMPLNATVTFSLVVDLDQIEVAFLLPVGTPTNLNAVVTMGATSGATVPGFGLQMSAQELDTVS
jgi:hypothetical protein